MNLEDDRQQINRQHDLRVFRDCCAIYSEGDLRELINNIYDNYQYTGAQSGKLIKLIDFLDLESNRFIRPELAGQSRKLSTYLNNFRDFLITNFHQGKETGNSDSIYFLTMQSPGFETEAFLIEFQMISMDVENAFKSYHAELISILPSI